MKKVIGTLDKSFNENVKILYPKNLEELKNTLDVEKKIIPVGSGLSFVPNFFSKNSVSISLINFKKFLKLDYENNIIHVEAGITVREVLNEISKESKYLKILPGWPDVTIGGCIANNIHGKNPYVDGIFQEIVEEIHLITPNSKELIIANRNINSEIFYNTCGGYGLTGIIISAKLKINSIINTSFFQKKIFTNTQKESLDVLLKNKECFCSYAWHDYSLGKKWGRGIVNLFYEKKNTKKSYKLNKVKTKYNLLKYKQPINFYNSLSIKFLNNLYIFFNSFSKEKNIDLDELNFPMNSFPIYFWYLLNGRKGFIESQIIIPFSNFENFNSELKDLTSKENVSIYGNVMKIFNGEKKNLSFDGRGVCINYEFLNDNENEKFFESYYNLISNYNGITSLYKDSKISKDHINLQYNDKYIYFLNFLEKFDLNKKFNSIFSDKIKS
tara:strand:+ start:431 stop:1756 length:1326 start_codon:yes stop_codon:yes gene_type:complete